jgi:hypothetical protein
LTISHLVLEVAKGAISANDLTACQTDASAGLYAQAMATFIQWVARDFEKTKAAFLSRVSELRAEAMQKVAHARTPDILANLQAAFEFFLDFGAASGAVGRRERDRMANDCWAALREAAAAQAKHQMATKPTARYLDLLRASLTSGRAHLQTTAGSMPDHSAQSCGWRFDGQNWKPQGDCIGWVDGDAIYCEPATAYGTVQVMARDMNESLALSEQTLKKRLAEKGLLASVDSKRETLTVRRTFGALSSDQRRRCCIS